MRTRPGRESRRGLVNVRQITRAGVPRSQWKGGQSAFGAGAGLSVPTDLLRRWREASPTSTTTSWVHRSEWEAAAGAGRSTPAALRVVESHRSARLCRVACFAPDNPNSQASLLAAGDSRFPGRPANACSLPSRPVPADSASRRGRVPPGPTGSPLRLRRWSARRYQPP